MASMAAIKLLKVGQSGWTCLLVMGFLRLRGRANGCFNGSRHSTVRFQVVSTHNDILSHLAPRYGGCEIDLGPLEHCSGEAAGQRGLMDLR
jgi:hypothetical protein